MSAPGLEPAYVLHRRAYRESSLLLELLTPEHGRLPAVARGARRPRAPRAALLNPFVPLLVSLRGRGEVRTLAAVEPAAGASPRLVGDALVAGLYVNELVMRLVPRQDPGRGLYEIYAATLSALARAPDRFGVLRLFEKRLLEELGYAPRLEHTTDGAPVREEVTYRYHPDRGPEPVAGTGADAGGVAVSGRCLLALARGELPEDPRMQREARRLMRCLLAPLLGHRPLRSRELLAAAQTARHAASRRHPQQGAGHP